MQVIKDVLCFDFPGHVDEHIRENISWIKIEASNLNQAEKIGVFTSGEFKLLDHAIDKSNIKERIQYFIRNLYKVDPGGKTLEYLVPFLPMVQDRIKIVALHNIRCVSSDIGHLNDLLIGNLESNYLDYTIKTEVTQTREFQRGDIKSKFLLVDREASNFHHDTSLKNYIKNPDIVIDLDTLELPTYHEKSYALSFIEHYLGVQENLDVEYLVEKIIHRNQFYNDEAYVSYISLISAFLKVLFPDSKDITKDDIQYIFKKVRQIKEKSLDFNQILDMEKDHYLTKSFIEVENLPMGKIDIHNGRYFSIKDNLSIYFKESSSITIKHRYVYYPYIFKNILEFIYGIHILKEESPFLVTLITDEDPKNPERQSAMLEDMKFALQCENIVFEYRINNQEDTAHYRTIVSNDGIELSLDKGFDLFNKPQLQFSKDSIYPEFRTTPDTYFIVKRTLRDFM